ncbi:MAG: hypothetical protein MUF52_03815 [Syntrophobacteraceae bacterium]|jgi:hypothetical protein|nr:hypothetical protein [Syntrophobacteraceae bacterium]
MKAFLNLPWSIQKQDPLWVPPILSEQRRILDPRTGPFFDYGAAQYFLALRDGRPVGRISAHVNPRYEERHDPGTGFFGFFECIDDPGVSNALFDAAAHWLGARGKHRILGPLSFSIYDEVGILVEGFDSLPVILHAHNPPYYQDLLLSWGFRKAIDWYAFRVTQRDIDAEAMEKRLRTIMRGGDLVLVSPTVRDFSTRADEVMEIFNESWDDNWGHVPFTRKEFHHIFRQLRPILRPEMIHLVLDQGRIVAFAINIPDLNPAIQRLNGRLTPWGILRLLYEARLKPLKKARVLLLGVRRPYQGRMLHHALILRTYLQIVRTTSCEVCDCSLIVESLGHFIRTVERFGGKRYKTFRLFEREI